MITTSSIGMPKMNKNGELASSIELALEKGTKKVDLDKISEIYKKISNENILIQKDKKIDIVSCNDFTIFDPILDTTVLLGKVPMRYYWEGGMVPLSIIMMMHKGYQKDKFDVPAMMMKKMFGTNYTTIIPELDDGYDFIYSDNKPILSYINAKKHIPEERLKVALYGPASYIIYSYDIEESKNEQSEKILEEMLEVYKILFENLERIKVRHIQFDEPFLSTNLSSKQKNLFNLFYKKLQSFSSSIKISINTYYGAINNNIETIQSINYDTLHIDLIESSDEEIDQIISALNKEKNISLGVIDGRRVFKNDIQKSLSQIEKFSKHFSQDKITISTSCPLFECPADVEDEKNLILKEICSFSYQKLDELNTIKNIFNGKEKNASKIIDANIQSIKQIDSITASINQNNYKDIIQNNIKTSKYSFFKSHRKKIKAKFPLMTQSTLSQSKGIKEKLIKRGSKNLKLSSIKQEIDAIVAMQEKTNLAIISHGEVERINNIEYFAEYCSNIIATENAYTPIAFDKFYRIPVIHGNISSDEEICQKIAKYFKKISKKPTKYSLIGPATFANLCSYPKNVNFDNITYNIIKILNKELISLEAIGIDGVEFDESFLLKKNYKDLIEKDEYYKKISGLYKILFNCENSELNRNNIFTILHTSNYDFHQDIDQLGIIDVDILSIECSRKYKKIFDKLLTYKHYNGFASGCFDADSDRVPVSHEIGKIFQSANRVLDEDQIFITTDVPFRKEHSLDKIQKAINGIDKSIKKIIENVD